MVGRFAYDNAGRPVSHKIQGGQEKIHRNRRYEWDVNYRLKKVTNELTRGEITYSYDQFSSLVSAKGNDILTVFRTFDEVGNIYEETGLYYNRFRYYDPETGQYTQQNPIGLAGGNPTLYGYVYNPLIEIDPWGLARMPSWMPTRQGYQRHHLIPVSVWEKYPILYDLGISFNNATNMTYLPVAEGIDLANPNSSLHKGWNDAHKLYNKYMEKKIKKLAKMATENNWDASKIQQEIRKLQSNTKSKLKGGIMKCH